MLFHDTVSAVALDVTVTPVGAATRCASNGAGLPATSARARYDHSIRFIAVPPQKVAGERGRDALVSGLDVEAGLRVGLPHVVGILGPDAHGETPLGGRR